MNFPTKPFYFSPLEKSIFTQGDCWVLARELHGISGWGIVTAGDEFDWYHAANRLPDGSIIDIMGIWEENTWLAYWHAEESKLLPCVPKLSSKMWTAKDFDAEILDADIDRCYPEIDASTYAQQIRNAL